MIWENKACSRCRRADTGFRGGTRIQGIPPNRSPGMPVVKMHPSTLPIHWRGIAPPTPRVSLIKKFCWSVGHLFNFMKNSFRELNGGVGPGMRLGSDRNFSAACTHLTA